MYCNFVIKFCNHFFKPKKSVSGTEFPNLDPEPNSMNMYPQHCDFTCVFLSSYVWENCPDLCSKFLFGLYAIKYFLFSVSCASRILLHLILHKSSLFAPRRLYGKSYQTKTCIFLNKGVSVSTLIINPRIGRY
jgi:hypothetical protein